MMKLFRYCSYSINFLLVQIYDLPNAKGLRKKKLCDAKLSLERNFSLLAVHILQLNWENDNFFKYHLRKIQGWIFWILVISTNIFFIQKCWYINLSSIYNQVRLLLFLNLCIFRLEKHFYGSQPRLLLIYFLIFSFKFLFKYLSPFFSYYFYLLLRNFPQKIDLAVLFCKEIEYFNFFFHRIP